MRRALALVALVTLARAVEPDPPSEALVALQKKTVNGTQSGAVRLATSNYTKLVLGKRDYTIVTLYTAGEAKYQCTTCALVTKEFALAAKSYNKAHPEPSTRRVFFAVVDFRDNAEVFAGHGFQNVPHAAVFPPSTAAEPMGPIPPARVKSALDGMLTADFVMGMLPARDAVPVLRPFMDKYGKYVWGGVGLVLALATLAVGLRRPSFWMLVSMGVYAVAISGAISCVIRTPPWYGMGQAGKPVLFSGGQEQYWLEGFAIALLNLLAGGAVIGLIATARSPKRTHLGKFVLALLLLGVFYAAYLRILSFYQLKTRWYKVEALVPDDFKRWQAMGSKALTLASKRALTWARAAAKEHMGVSLPL